MSKKEKPVQHPEYVKAPMERRQFFGKIAAAAGLTGAAGYVSFAPENWPGSLRDVTGLLSKPRHQPFRLTDFRVQKPTGVFTDVGVARGTRQADGTYSNEQLARMLTAAIDQVGGIKHFIKNGDIVLIKPNVAFDRSPNLGATSNPEILETLIRMVLGAGAQEVRVADNPIESPPDCFKKSKIEYATLKGGGRVYLPDSNSFKMLNTPGARLIENWWFFHRPFLNVDKVIGFAPVKDHNLCHASMGIKNWYGLLGGTRNQFHQDIDNIVSDLSIMLRPTLTVLDGTNVLMINGPTGGDPSNVKKGDVIMAGTDPVALDSWAFEHVLERDKNDKPTYLTLAQEKHAASADKGEVKYEIDYEGRVKEVQLG